jgi:hypothetical protein
MLISKRSFLNLRLQNTGHPFWRFVENRYCAFKISPIFIKFSPNVSQCMQNMIKVVKLAKNKIMSLRIIQKNLMSRYLYAFELIYVLAGFKIYL